MPGTMGAIRQGMEERRIYRETLNEAALVLGGSERLAIRLDVEVNTVDKWLAGTEKPPLHVFLEALEAIAERPWRTAACP